MILSFSAIESSAHPQDTASSTWNMERDETAPVLVQLDTTLSQDTGDSLAVDSYNPPGKQSCLSQFQEWNGMA